jgi:hypothetical protein
MKLQFLPVLDELQPYIATVWLCESETGLPPTDATIVAPNGCPRMIVPFENSLISVGIPAPGRLSGLWNTDERGDERLVRL